MSESKNPERVAIGSDHIGYVLKEEIISFLQETGIEYIDVGASSSERTDYPLYAKLVANLINSGQAELGILICGTGVGMSISANKIPGIRAVVCSEAYSAEFARRHNNANVLCFGSRVVAGGLARTLIKAFLSAAYEGGRHACRVDMINALEAEAFLAEKGTQH
ncbi:MAG: ribose 5-phosphate isomerase B [Chloroflexi bacterium]|nr:MAG: ribose 5-phosphate isomerase B [Chloroflexota bacterium]